MRTYKQYRVEFTQLHNVNGNMLRGIFSTKWFNSLEAAENCRWIRQDDARIVCRDYSQHNQQQEKQNEQLQREAFLATHMRDCKADLIK